MISPIGMADAVFGTIGEKSEVIGASTHPTLAGALARMVSASRVGDSPRSCSVSFRRGGCKDEVSGREHVFYAWCSVSEFKL